MRDYLSLDLGHNVNIKRVSRLYKLMNLRTIYQAPKTTTRDPDNYIYPYLLRNLDINQQIQVWKLVITKFLWERGFIYLVEIIAVNGEKVILWNVSITLQKNWVLKYW